MRRGNALTDERVCLEALADATDSDCRVYIPEIRAAYRHRRRRSARPRASDCSHESAAVPAVLWCATAGCSRILWRPLRGRPQRTYLDSRTQTLPVQGLESHAFRPRQVDPHPEPNDCRRTESSRSQRGASHSPRQSISYFHFSRKMIVGTAAENPILTGHRPTCRREDPD